MMTRIFLFLVLALPAMGQNARRIERVSNILESSTVPEIIWYQGESVTLDVFAKRGTDKVAWPSTASSVLRVWLESAPSTLYVNKTNAVYAASTGQTRNTLTPAQSNLATNDYKFSVAVYDSSTFMGIAAEGDLEVRYAPQTGLDMVTTVPIWPTDLDELSDVAAPSPTSGQVLGFDGTNWVAVAAGSGSGDITAVSVSGGLLSGGGTNGAVTIGLTTNALDTAGMATDSEVAAAIAGTHAAATVTGGLLTISGQEISLTTNAVRASVSGIYLPLAGGTITGSLGTTGDGSTISTAGDHAFIYTAGSDANIYTSGANAGISTSGANAGISTDGANANISTWGGGDIYSSGNLSADGIISGVGSGITGINGANITNGTAIAGLVDMPSGHTAGVTNLVGIAGDGVTPVFVPTSSVWQGFRAHRATSTLTLAANATTVVIYNTETRDPLGLYDTSTGYFRPNKTGLWRITAGVSIGGAVGINDTSHSLALFNLSATRQATLCSSRTEASGKLSAPINGSGLADLTSGSDYYIGFVSNDTANSQTMAASQATSYFAAEFITE